MEDLRKKLNEMNVEKKEIERIIEETGFALNERIECLKEEKPELTKEEVEKKLIRSIKNFLSSKWVFQDFNYNYDSEEMRKLATSVVKERIM